MMCSDQIDTSTTNAKRNQTEIAENKTKKVEVVEKLLPHIISRKTLCINLGIFCFYLALCDLYNKFHFCLILLSVLTTGFVRIKKQKKKKTI